MGRFRFDRGGGAGGARSDRSLDPIGRRSEGIPVFSIAEGRVGEASGVGGLGRIRVR